ncbi:IPT/TIG domain-containing protein [Polaribacter uvawellassae]|uniref:IPT/TIG domain-containing protein n=1 Tax=Polaribacter uvawellassae TaxID=3133495 RepID=UPI00321BA065
MKKKNIQSLAIIFFSVLFLIQCTENDILERSYPTIETLQVTDVSENGVKLNATINNINQYDIIEYGFVWSVRTFPDINISDKKIISSNLTSGGFSATITTTLVNGNKYYVRSFVKTKDYLVYGNQKEFMSFGSSAALILSLEPNSGVWGDTIQIKGKNFSYINSNNKVTFKDKVASVIKSNDSIITAVVPEGVNSKEVTVGLEIANRETYAATKFIIKSPTITSIAPLTATFGEEITITGDNFGLKPEFNKVYFGDVLAEVSASNKNSIKVIVPNDLELSFAPVKVQSNAIDVTYNQNFILKKPVITFVDDNIKSNTEIIIKADYFNPKKENNKILFDNIEGEIISIENKNIKVKIPLGPFKKRELKIKLKVADLIVEYSKEVSLIDQWILVSDDLPFRYYGHSSYYLSANNEIYLVARPKHYSEDDDYLWKLNPNDFSWERFDIPNNIQINNFISDGINLYFYDGSNNNFWEYNLATNQWAQKQSYPGAKRRGASQFLLNGEIYIGLGSNDENYTSVFYKNFYKYNPSSNLWKQISDFPYNNSFRRNFTSTFVINNIAYLGNGASHTGMTDFWSYNANSDSWLRIADFPDARSRSSSFALNNFGYITGGSKVGGGNNTDCWQYDPNLDTWNKIENIGIIGRGSHFSFVLNGKAYVGGGSNESGGSNVFDMYEYKPD